MLNPVKGKYLNNIDIIYLVNFHALWKKIQDKNHELVLLIFGRVVILGVSLVLTIFQSSDDKIMVHPKNLGTALGQRLEHHGPAKNLGATLGQCLEQHGPTKKT